jgi:hypothetical protein
MWTKPLCILKGRMPQFGMTVTLNISREMNSKGMSEITGLTPRG